MTSNGVVRRMVGEISRLGSVLPFVWFLGVLSFYLRAKVYLGYWPKPSFPDPKLLPFEFHHWIFMMAVFPLFLTIVVLPIAWLVESKTFQVRIRGYVVTYMSGWLLIGSTFAIGGIDFVRWFLD